MKFPHLQRNFFCVRLKGFALLADLCALGLVTSNHLRTNHVFQFTRFLGLKCTSTGHSAQLVCVSRIVSNSYVI